MKHFNFNLATWAAPHWLTLIGTTVLAALATYAMAIPPAQWLAALGTTAGIIALLKGAAVAVLVALVNLAKTQLTPDQAKDAKLLMRSAAKTTSLLLMAMVVMCTSCITAAPIVPVTPANKDAIAACQTDANVNNALVWTSVGLGAATTTLGSVAAANPDPKAQTGFAITTAILAGLTTVATGGKALAASSYANGDCSQFVAPLAAARFRNASLPLVSPFSDGPTWHGDITTVTVTR